MTTYPASQLPLIGVAHFSTTPVPAAQIVSMMQECGAQILRTDWYWSDIEQTKGVYSLPTTPVDYIDLNTALDAAGLQKLLLLDYGNSLYTSGWQNPPTSADAWAAYANFANWLIANVECWGVELQNEPNNPQFTNNDPDPENTGYGYFLAAKAIASAHPSVPILTGGVGGCSGAWGDQNAFMTEVAAVAGSAMALFTAQAIHPYNSSGGAVSVETFVTNYRSQVPYNGWLSITEWGWEDDWIGANETTRAMYVAQAICFAIWTGIRPVFCLYSLIDSGPEAVEQETYGLFYANGTTKPAVAAMAAIMTALAGCVTYSLSHPDGNAGVWRITINKAGGVITTITWTATTTPVVA